MAARQFQVQVVVFYVIVALSAVVWLWWRGEPMARLWTSGEEVGAHVHWGLQVAAGLGVGLLVVACSQWLYRSSPRIQAMTNEVSAMLPPISDLDAALAAACSGIAEEVFFRGVMQHAWGLWPTVGVFAFVHGFFHPKLLPWMAFAGVCAIVFGYAVLVFGSILAPVVAHVVINFLNLRYIGRHVMRST